ncbi:hypothetical protein F383_28508 [Gossypium arboreum]|uniref:Uncharacterized protein n=1 Tax=Gossypium arboreum TaxID=29729 RepID=A0A0B0MVX5_GOSAR|nr:hypothetical protein F383_28508 [Gossypium arboreum]
MRPGLVIPL